MSIDMKYVVYDCGKGAEIYMFPTFVTHNNFVSRMGFVSEDIIGAGFVSPDLECYGHSISLKIKSRPEADTALLRRMLGIENPFRQ